MPHHADNKSNPSFPPMLLAGRKTDALSDAGFGPFLSPHLYSVAQIQHSIDAGQFNSLNSYMLNICKESMDAKFSEDKFREFLDIYNFQYQKDFIVGPPGNPCDVDFLIITPTDKILIDVKEVRDSVGEKGICEVDAFSHIRDDIKKLRKKFKFNKPVYPLLLATINLSTNYYTGLTVARAMLGDIGISYDPIKKCIIKPLHHLHSGNAALTQVKNTSISGVFVFDIAVNRHVLFINPYAVNQMPSNFFPDVKEVNISKITNKENLKKLSDIMFWNINFQELI